MLALCSDVHWKESCGKRMLNKVVSTFQVDRRVNCMANCSLSSVCDSYNYRAADKTCQINTHRRASSTLTDVPVQHSPVVGLWLVQLPCCWQDVPVQHSRHSAHGQLDRHCRRQRLELVELALHPTPLNQLRTSLAPLNDAHYIMNQTIFMLSLHVCSFFRITVSVTICISTKNGHDILLCTLLHSDSKLGLVERYNCVSERLSWKFLDLVEWENTLKVCHTGNWITHEICQLYYGLLPLPVVLWCININVYTS